MQPGDPRLAVTWINHKATALLTLRDATHIVQIATNIVLTIQNAAHFVMSVTSDESTPTKAVQRHPS
jgi:hypothetical protein